MTSLPRPAISLASALFGFVLLGAVLFSYVTFFLVFDRVKDTQSAALEEAVKVRGQHAALDFARMLDNNWDDLKAIADQLTTDDPAALADAINLVVVKGSGISWAGFARPDGVVVQSSNDDLRDVDVSSQRWFQRGLIGDFAGDMREVTLRTAHLDGTGNGHPRFIELAAPVRDSAGQVKGVVGFQIDFTSAEAYLAENAASLEIDLFLVNQNGDVIIATDGSNPGSADLHSFQAAAGGVASAHRETWPDGVEYFTMVIPDVAYGDLPSFGWRLVARISPEKFDATSADLTRSLGMVLTGAIVLLMLLTAAFIQIFIRPIAQLADNAKRIADGANEYPLELQGTAEMGKLSAALAQLQAAASDPRGRATRVQRRRQSQRIAVKDNLRAMSANNATMRTLTTPGASPSV